MKPRILLASVFAAAFVGFLFVTTPVALGQGFNYVPLEQIPGSAGAKTLPDYISGIYKFGIWTVGIAALFMLTVGGFVYMTSGGNTATLSRAKGYISDALIGLILAMLAYLILYVVNPDLVNLNLSKFSEVGGTVAPSTAATVDTPITATTTDNATKNQTVGSSGAPTGGGTPWPSDKSWRDNLKSFGITINAPNCTVVGQKGCTSVYNLSSSSMSDLVAMKKDCNCGFVISGGTEYWLHGNRATNSTNKTKHVPGNGVVDVRKGGAFEAYVKKFPVACYSKGRPIYKVTAGGGTAWFWDEDGAHWHADIDFSLCN